VNDDFAPADRELCDRDFSDRSSAGPPGRGIAECRDLANDVPCKILKKHPDGTYEITVGWTRFFQTHAPGTKYRNTRETSFWDQKCKGQTL